MSRLKWDEAGTRFYESGVDRGVLYIGGNPGVPWNGLISVTETPSGGETKSYYIDGEKYLTVSSIEEFEASVTAYTYPEEFAECDGTLQPRPGMFITQQSRKPFSLSYRTQIGNDQSADYGYKIHIVYNAMASPTDQDYRSHGASAEPSDFNWNLITRAPVMDGYKRTPHVVIDSRYTDPATFSAIEDILYGTESASARIPSFEELLSLYDSINTLVVIDNGDGTFTVDGPPGVIRMLDDTMFEITSPTAIFVDEDTYTISSQ